MLVNQMDMQLLGEFLSRFCAEEPSCHDAQSTDAINSKILGKFNLNGITDISNALNIDKK